VGWEDHGEKGRSVMSDRGGASKTKYSYRNLRLWQRAQELAVDIVELVDALPTRRSVDSIARQIVRSVTSIGANIAEGHGRFTTPAYRNHLSIAKGSACETDSWLDLLRRLNLISAEQEGPLHRKCDALIGAITGRINDLERTGQSAVREHDIEYSVNLEPGGSEVLRF
jgi:four helix bundle protein